MNEKLIKDLDALAVNASQKAAFIAFNSCSAIYHGLKKNGKAETITGVKMLFGMDLSKQIARAGSFFIDKIEDLFSAIDEANFEAFGK